VAFSNPSGHLLIGDREGNLSCLTTSQKRLWRREFTGEMTGVAAWPENDQVATGTQDCWFRLLMANGDPAWELTMERAVWSVAIDPAERLMAIGTGDSVGLLEPDGKPRWLEPVGRAVISVALSGGAKRIVACADQDLFCFDITGELLWKKWFKEPLWDVSLTRSGDRVAAGCWNGILYVLDGADGQPLWQGETGGQVHGVDQCDDGKVLTGGHDGCLRLWSSTGDKLVEETLDGPVNSVAISPDQRFVACTLLDLEQVQLFKLTGQGSETQTSAPFMDLPGSDGPETDVPILPFGNPDEPLEGSAPGPDLFDLFNDQTGNDGASPSTPPTPPTASTASDTSPASTGAVEEAAAMKSGSPVESPGVERKSAFARFSDEVDERSVIAQLSLGIAAFDEGHFEEALDHFIQATNADGDEPRAWFNKAMALHMLERYREALEAVVAALRLDPDYEQALQASKVMMECYRRSQEGSASD